MRSFIVSSLFTGPKALALLQSVEGAEGTYERQQHEFVLSSRNEVAVFCDAGDTLIKGDCEGKAESLVPLQNPMLFDQVGMPRSRDADLIYLDAREVTENGRTGWACWSKVVRPDEELRITSAAKCKKAGANAIKIKTPGKFPGA